MGTILMASIINPFTWSATVIVAIGVPIVVVLAFATIVLTELFPATFRFFATLPMIGTAVASGVFVLWAVVSKYVVGRD